jgi:hypothetical protein
MNVYRALLLPFLALMIGSPAFAGIAFVSDMQITLDDDPGCGLHNVAYTAKWSARVAVSMGCHGPFARIHDAGDIVEACTNTSPLTAAEYRQYLDTLTLADGAAQLSNPGACCGLEYCSLVCAKANPTILRGVAGNHDYRALPQFNEVFGWNVPTERWRQDWTDGIHILGISVGGAFSTADVAALRAILDDDGAGYQPTIVYLHHALYSGNQRVGGTCTNQPSQDICTKLQPLFEEEGVDLVVTGHAHDYEHLQLGTVAYLVIGGAGAEFQPLDVPLVRPQTVVRGLVDGALFHHWLEVENLGTGLNIQVHRVEDDGDCTAGEIPACPGTPGEDCTVTDSVFDQFTTPAGLDPMVVPNSRAHTITTPPAGGASTWEFRWQTDRGSLQSLDQVAVTVSPKAPAGCPGPFTLTASTPGVLIDVVPRAGGGYDHTLVWSQGPECAGGCGWNYTTSSALKSAGGVVQRSYSNSGFFKVLLCAMSV